MKKEMLRQIIIVSFLTVMLTGAVHWELVGHYAKSQRLDITRQASQIMHHMDYELSRSFLFLEDTAHLIAITPEITQKKFLSFVTLISRNKVLIKNIAAAPNLVIRYVYPMEGNQTIIGQSYKDLPGQWPDVQKAIATQKLVTSGPLKLIQGGTGLIGRVAVYTHDGREERLWGIVSSVIDMERLYQTLGVQASGMVVSLKKTGRDFKPFYGDASLFLPQAQAVILPVIMQGVNWELAAMPKKGWAKISGMILSVDLILILLGSAVAYWRVKSIQNDAVLKEIRQSLDQSQAIAHLGSWSLNLNTQRLWMSDETYRIFGLDKTTTVPTMTLVKNRIHDDDRTQVDESIDLAIKECADYTMDHRIVKTDGTLAYVEARGFVHCSQNGTPQKFTGTILDITPRKEAEKKIKDREAQVRAMASASHDALIMIDASDKIHFWSDMAEKMFGWTTEEAMGQSMHRLITLPEDCDKALNGLKHFSKTGTGPVIGSVMEFNALRKDGTIIPVERSVAAFKIADAFYAVGSIRDISERKKREEQLRQLATTDGLTGLYNRRRFMELIQKEFKKSIRHAVSLSIIMFDADKFKMVNDTYGHEAGDCVLVDISRITRQVVRETDFPGRIGGEEFVVGLPHTDAEGAVQLAERLRSSFEASKVETADGRIIRYTVSFGVTSLDPQSPVDVETLMKHVDKALYQAKEKGRNRVEQY
nr:diguanylate cyclase [uncultured Desulfobacter sp.]